MNNPQSSKKLKQNINALIQEYCEQHFQFTFDPNHPQVRLHEPSFDHREISAALECLLDTRVTMAGEVQNFEREYALKFKHDHVVMSNSGSSANLLALSALMNPLSNSGLKAGDEVIVPALSWSTTVWPVVQNGLVPVLVDCDQQTLNIDANAVEAAITSKTRAVMLVHVYGNVCDMDAICDICKRHNLILIEDACEAMGASFKGTPVGNFGLIGTFSTYFSHHITSLEGGFCVSQDYELDQLMRMLRAHGWLRDFDKKQKFLDMMPEYDDRFVFGTLGYNLRAVEPLAAFGRVQLSKLDDFIETRMQNAAYLHAKLSPYSCFSFQKMQEYAQPSWFGFIIRVQKDAPFTRDQLCAELNKHHIETRPVICGNIARQPAMQHINHRIDGSLEQADNVMRDAFSVGIHQHVDHKACDYIVSVISDFVSAKR